MSAKDMIAAAAYEQWLHDPYFDEKTRQELAVLTGPAEIMERFGPFPSFGTAGIRAHLGAGSSRFNRYVVRKIAQALADLLLGQAPGPSSGVAIAYDTRPDSAAFAKEAALTLAANGCPAYLFTSVCPTPQLSFAVRYLRAAAGMMITASHNSWIYNGCKIYDEHGCQYTPQQAEQLSAVLAGRRSWHLNIMEEKTALARGLLLPLDAQTDAAYREAVRQGLWNLPLTREKGASYPIVYTPFYGAGRQAVKEILQDCGFESVFIVPEQEYADGIFATLPQPNPEYPANFDIALDYARRQQAELLLATDPDADRLGVCCRHGADYQILSGNQVALLLAYYLFSQRTARGLMPSDGILIRSIVSTPLIDRLAAAFGVAIRVTPVGSCQIGAEMLRIEQRGKGSFLFGFEESLGYVMPGHCPEKDAIAGAALISEAALFYQETRGQTLVDVLEDIYRQFGYCLHSQETIALANNRARESAEIWLERLRHLPGRQTDGLMLLSCEDMAALTGQKVQVLRLLFAEGSSVIARSSGTEPKVKLYYSSWGATQELALKKLSALQHGFRRLLEKN